MYEIDYKELRFLYRKRHINSNSDTFDADAHIFLRYKCGYLKLVFKTIKWKLIP